MRRRAEPPPRARAGAALLLLACAAPVAAAATPIEAAGPPAAATPTEATEPAVTTIEAAGPAAAVGAAERLAPPIGPAPADRAVLERVLAESDVDTVRSRPGPWSYAGALVRRLLAWIGGGLERTAAALSLAPQVVRIAAWAAAALAAAAVVAAGAALVRRRRRSGGRVEPPAAAAAPAGPRARAAGDRRAEIERSLAAGRIAEALAAVWEWLADALCGARFEASWTGGELLAHARRPDLAPAVARLDAMTYGPRRPLSADVRDLLGALDRSVGDRVGCGSAGPEAEP